VSLPRRQRSLTLEGLEYLITPMKSRAVQVLSLCAVAALVIQTSWLPVHLIEHHHFTVSQSEVHDHVEHFREHHHDTHDHEHHSHGHEQADAHPESESHEQHPASDHPSIDARLIGAWLTGSILAVVLPEHRCIRALGNSAERSCIFSDPASLRSQVELRLGRSRAPPSV